MQRFVPEICGVTCAEVAKKW